MGECFGLNPESILTAGREGQKGHSLTGAKEGILGACGRLGKGPPWMSLP